MLRTAPSTVAVAAVLTLIGPLAMPRAEQVVQPPFQVQLQQGVPIRDPNQGRTRQIPVGTGVISGMVMAVDTGRPLSRARVTLSGVASGTEAGRSGAPAGAPPAGAQVINGAQVNGTSLSRAVLTDAQGEFTFARVPAGNYSVSVSREQYLATSYGQKKYSRPGTTIGLGDGQKVSIKLPMQRGGVITGVITGEDGEPLINAQVRAMRYDSSSGYRRLLQTGFANSDDRGEYRMYGLQPGDYLVAVTQNPSDISMDRSLADLAAVESAVAAANVSAVPPGQFAAISVPVAMPVPGDPGPPGYASTYYPNATSLAAATSVTVGAGETKSNVDVPVQYVRASNIQGLIVGAPQNAAVQITVMPVDPALAGALQLPSSRATPDGKFVLRNVPPGQYLLFATTMPGQNVQIVNNVVVQQTPKPEDQVRLWGRTTATVDGQFDQQAPVTITMQPSKSISGRVMFDTQIVPDLSRTRVVVTISQPPSPQQIPTGPIPTGQVTSDGRFTIDGVPPGRWILRATVNQSGPNNTAIVGKSSIVNGQDTLDFPLDFAGDQDVSGVTITMTDKLTELSGTLTEASGKPGSDYTILVIASDSRFWVPGSRRMLTSHAGADGRYSFRNLPAGDYMIAAVTDFEPGGQYDPEFLKALSSAAIRLTLAEGAKKTQDLRVAR